MIILIPYFQGIEWTNVDYFNNAVICDLIEKVNILNHYQTYNLILFICNFLAPGQIFEYFVNVIF